MPAVKHRRKLVGHGCVRAYLPHCLRELLCKIRQRVLAKMLECEPLRILPVDFPWDFHSGYSAELRAARITAADQRPEGHVDKDSLDGVAQDFRNLFPVEFKDAGLVRTGEVIASAVSLPVDVAHVAFRKSLRGVIVVIDGVIGDRDNSLRFQSADRFPESVASPESLVHMPALCRIIAVAVVVAGVNHGRFHAGKFHEPDILLRIEPAHVFGFQVRDMVVDQQS